MLQRERWRQAYVGTVARDTHLAGKSDAFRRRTPAARHRPSARFPTCACPATCDQLIGTHGMYAARQAVHDARYAAHTDALAGRVKVFR